MMEITIIKHFRETDFDFTGHYVSISAHLNQKTLVEYGDYYRDYGEEKMEGWKTGVKWVLGENVSFREIKMNDK